MNEPIPEQERDACHECGEDIDPCACWLCDRCKTAMAQWFMGDGQWCSECWIEKRKEER